MRIIATPLRLLALLCVSTLVLSACSMPRLFYGQADWLLLREVNGYLDLNDAQSAQLAAAIALGLQRHRSEELPEIAATLRAFAVHARAGLRPAEVRAGIERVHTLALRSAELGIEPLSKVLADLDPQQRAHLAGRFDRRNNKYQERHALDAPLERRKERRAQRTVDTIEHWTGELTPEQVALVREIRDAMPDSASLWLAYTQSRQHRLLALLDAGASAREIASLLRALWLQHEDLPPALVANRKRQVAALEEMLLRLDATLNSTQRMHLTGRLEKLARDAQSLSREA